MSPAPQAANAVEAALPRGAATLEIPFYDCDPAGIVWHGNHAKYFELARAALMQGIGYSYLQMAESGYTWPVIDYWVRYVKPLRFGQRITVEARMLEWQFRLKIAYAVRDADSGARLCRGHTVQVAVRIDNGEMQLAAPAVLRQRLGLA
jgi:acyl-CoA thioester hydrolase